ncbi:MAG: hypothetical protein HC850_16475 [Rhodomicrobium sp.]|nr:hypothetical protein [Rhodomicrobium sp.]
MTIRNALGAFALTVAAAIAPPVLAAPTAQQNDYPTIAIADYVFGCMAVNGQTRQALEKCSCSIDLIASILPYERYVQAETTMSLRQLGGDKGAIFKTEPQLQEAVADLKRAQAESEIRCF